MKNSKTTSKLVPRAKPFALQAQLRARSLAILLFPSGVLRDTRALIAQAGTCCLLLCVKTKRKKK